MIIKINEFLKAIQSRVARIAVGASTVRGRGNKGAVSAARSYFCNLNFASLGKNPNEFRKTLDIKTKELLTKLPNGARHWGIARKLLNIFLRDCFYTTYLESKYDLGRFEEAFEIPLDSITAKQIKKCAGRGNLPIWLGVKYVTPSVNTKFQDAAASEAVKRNIVRIHLDAVWWSQSRDKANFK